MKTARQLVLELLIKINDNKAYSNILLDEALVKEKLDERDKKFASALFYGVIERQLTLDYIITKYSTRPSDKLSADILQILRMGIYQLLYMNSVPENAAVNESVNLAKKNKNPAVSGFVNAVLRNFIRDEMVLPEFKDKIKNLSLKYSCPEWLIKKWINEYGFNEAEIMLKTSLGRPPVTIRVNNTKISLDDAIEELALENIIAKKNPALDNCAEIVNGASLEKSEAYKKGLFHVQDLSSQYCCHALSPKEGQIILDMCSAPGGKSFTIAELINNNGYIYAYELHENRSQLVWKGIKRLGLTSIKSGVNNAKVINKEIPMADRILCDVPCSGLGVIRRKPEIKYKNPEDFENLPSIQYDILTASANYLKIGGELVYSTCTLSHAENDEVIKKFLKDHDNFEGVLLPSFNNIYFNDFKATILPDMAGSDGFFVSKIKRVR